MGVTGDDLRAAFVYVGPVGDAGWTHRHDQGRQCLAKQSVKTAHVESVPATPEVANVERDFLAQGFDVIRLQQPPGWAVSDRAGGRHHDPVECGGLCGRYTSETSSAHELTWR